MYVYGPAVEVASPTVFMFWLRACRRRQRWNSAHIQIRQFLLGIYVGIILKGIINKEAVMA